MARLLPCHDAESKTLLPSKGLCPLYLPQRRGVPLLDPPHLYRFFFALRIKGCKRIIGCKQNRRATISRPTYLLISKRHGSRHSIPDDQWSPLRYCAQSMPSFYKMLPVRAIANRPYITIQPHHSIGISSALQIALIYPIAYATPAAHGCSTFICGTWSGIIMPRKLFFL